GSGEDVALVVLENDRLTRARLRRILQHFGGGRLGVEDHRLVATVELEDVGNRLDTLAVPTAFVAEDANLHGGVLGRERRFQHLAVQLRGLGMTRVEVMPTEGHPAVYAEWLGAPGKPTILLYGHYDVQPPDPLDLWHTPPFEPTLRDGKLYARGAVDDKGQVYMHVAAIEAHMKVTGKLPLNLKLLIEGEEEVGSLHLESFIRTHRKMLDADVIVVS